MSATTVTCQPEAPAPLQLCGALQKILLAKLYPDAVPHGKATATLGRVHTEFLAGVAAASADSTVSAQVRTLLRWLSQGMNIIVKLEES